MTESPPRRPRAAVVAGLALAVTLAGFPLLADVPAPPTANEPAAPTVALAAEPPADAPAPRRPMTEPNDASRDDATAIEVERRFNDLRRELLDDRMKLVDQLFVVVAIMMTFLTIVVPVVGGIVSYFGFKRFHKIEAEAHGNVDKARTHAEEAQKLVGEIKEKLKEAKSDADAIKRKRWTTDGTTGPELDRDNTAEKWFSVGNCYARESHLQEAIDAYDKAIQLNQNMAEAYNNRGVAKSRRGQHEDAIADLDVAIGLKRDYVEAHNNRGNARSGHGQYEDAIADYDKVIELNPDYAATHYNRGDTYLHLGSEDKARRDFEKALELARAAGDEITADMASRALAQLSGDEDP